MRLYVLDADSIDENGKSVIRMFCKNQKGETVVCLDRDFRPYFYILPSKGKEQAVKRKLKSIRSVKIGKVEIVKKRIGLENARLLKVECDMSSDVSKARDIVKEWKEVKEEYEYSISFYRRYMIDKQISGWVDISGNSAKSRGGPIRIESIKSVLSPKAPDLKILSFKAVGSGKIDAITFKTKDKEVVIDGNEKEIIENFERAVKEIDPDVIAGFGSDRFDMPLIQKRAGELKIGFGLSRDGSKIKFQRRSFAPSASMRGVFHLDLHTFASNILKTQIQSDMISLGAVSAELLKDEGIEIEYESAFEKFRKGEIGALEIAKKEAEISYRLGEFILPQVTELSELCGQLPFDVSRMTYSQLVEWYLSKRAYAMGYAIPNQPKWGDIESRSSRASYAGGFVKEPLSGMHDSVAVMDFRSLYPSIIATFNISPETLNCRCCKGKKVPERDYSFCKKRKGFVSSAIAELIERRSKIKSEMKFSKESARLNNEQLAVKTVTNAMYGYLGFAQSKWYCLECADASASYGRFFIKKVIEEAEKFGFTVVYGDTDSVFVTGKKDVKAFLKKVNKELPGIVRLDLQGIYSRGIFVPKGSGAAKKRYALIDAGGNLTVKGLEMVRRDWCKIAKRTQEEILRLVLEKNDKNGAIEHAKRAVLDIRSGRVPLRDLVIIEQLSKPLEEYKLAAPHVSAARKMREKGRLVDEETPIMFVIADGEGSISQRAVPFEDASGFDAEYYIDHQVVPAAMRVLSALGVEKSSLET